MSSLYGDPMLLKIRDPVVRGYFRHIYLNAHRYKYGWVEAKTGRSRSGKTESNILMSVLLSRKGFDMRQVAWKPREYAQVVQDAKPGEPIVWSEVGRGLNSRKWQSLQNIISGELMQIMQIKKLIVFIDVINLSFVDTQIRNMIRAYCEVFRPPNDSAYMNVFGIHNNYRTGDTFYPHPWVKTDEGYVKLRRITFGSRLQELAPKIYDDFKQVEKKDKTEGMRRAKDALKDLGGENGHQMGTFDYINELKKDPDREGKYINRFGRWDKKLIRINRGIKDKTADEIAAFLNNERSNPRAEEARTRSKKTVKFNTDKEE